MSDLVKAINNLADAIIELCEADVNIHLHTDRDKPLAIHYDVGRSVANGLSDIADAILEKSE